MTEIPTQIPTLVIKDHHQPGFQPKGGRTVAACFMSKDLPLLNEVLPSLTGQCQNHFGLIQLIRICLQEVLNRPLRFQVVQ